MSYYLPTFVMLFSLFFNPFSFTWKLILVHFNAHMQDLGTKYFPLHFLLFIELWLTSGSISVLCIYFWSKGSCVDKLFQDITSSSYALGPQATLVEENLKWWCGAFVDPCVAELACHKRGNRPLPDSHLRKTIKHIFHGFNYWKTNFYVPMCAYSFLL